MRFGKCSNSSWAYFALRDPQGSLLVLQSVLNYANDLVDNLASNPKLFDVNTLLFSIVRNIYPNNDLIEKFR